MKKESISRCELHRQDSNDDLDFLIQVREKETFDLYEPLVTKNTENFIGVSKIPIGIAGPLVVNSEHVEKGEEIYVPLASTEGTIIASVSRGMKILRLSGGVHTYTNRIGSIQRAPCFRFATPIEARAFCENLRDWEWLRAIAESSTSHGKLLDISCFPVGRYAHVRISIFPGDSYGANMVSKVAIHVIKALVKKFPGIEKHYSEGGLSSEKSPSSIGMLLGRGRSVVATANIPKEILSKMGRARPEDILEFYEIWETATEFRGGVPSTAGVINTLSAIYAATGQDLACIPESRTSKYNLNYDPFSGVLHWELIMPSIVCATVGGGTHLPTQSECLRLLGCLGDGKVDRFAEIIAATALAHEISFVSAVCASGVEACEWLEAHAALSLKTGSSVPETTFPE
uniref:3-hydroxy-3-methylglutaryl-coenzyme A reductase n=1 Tax=Candidatus Kentrum sp. MB TaxID=2138164 RepID=A0A450Y0C5_9GAMM|nr:MAG: 3-hydroxy-3-methylglutaryl-coenzyme A reductase [Candidatus Kentron sp. MB]VFK34984.1 MAG: 3-hydroxy-3-methylglutaryl-coenzyme A reductase [Candidatus Kentron sp. MB]VFK77096.1 MAG: 3-hydroxy-3-methylglutaryl-coenzyme A reductase [Candidatus Kentron sp. MB]